MKRFVLWSLLAMSCGPQAASLEITPKPVPVLKGKGDKQALAVQAFDEKGKPIKEPVVGWVSSNRDIATVENGAITAVRSGNVNITARSGNAQASVDVVVAIPVSLEVVQGKFLMVAKGKSLYISGLLRNERGTPISGPALAPFFPIEWTSSDDSVAIVEKSRLKGLAPGYATLTAHYHSLSAALEVRVLEKDLQLLTLTPTRMTFDGLEQTKVFQARMLDTAGRVVEDVPLLWFTSNPSVATVDEDGRVQSHSEGKALISVSYGRYRAGSDVIVTAPKK